MILQVTPQALLLLLASVAILSGVMLFAYQTGRRGERRPAIASSLSSSVAGVLMSAGLLWSYDDGPEAWCGRWGRRGVALTILLHGFYLFALYMATMSSVLVVSKS